MNLSECISKSRDFIMGLSMICIMLFHQLFVDFLPLKAFHLFGHFGVDLFFFVSGFGLVFSLKKHSTADFYQRRMKRLLIPILFCCSIKYLLSHSVWPFSLQPCGLSTLIAWELWFFKPLVIFYLLAPFLFRILQRYSKQGVVLTVWTISLFYLFLFPDCESSIFAWSLVRFPAFVLGMSVGLGYRIEDKFIRYGWLIALLILCLRLGIVLDYLPINELVSYPLFTITIPSITYLFTSSIHYLKRGVTNFVNRVGKMSIQLYIWHQFIYNVIERLDLNPYMQLIVALFLTFPISYLCYMGSGYVDKKISSI